MPGGWDPRLYAKFSDHRLRPAWELLQRVPLEAPERVADLGCGTGNVTRLLAERWPMAKVLGVDSSAPMLERARASSSTIDWIEADVAGWQPDPALDVIYSNAALHWLGDNVTLVGKLAGFLAAGGCLAVQMPLSWDLPSHRLMRETLAGGGPGGQPLGTEELRRAMEENRVASADAYHEALAAQAMEIDIWETEYRHVLEGEDAVLDWVRSTSLRPILNGLDDRERDLFLATYRRLLREAYPPRPDGRTVYPFRRLFMVAHRGSSG